LMTFLPLHAPTEALEAAPELIVLKDPVSPTAMTGYRVESISFAPPHTIHVKAHGGERILLIGATRGYIYPAGYAGPVFGDNASTSELTEAEYAAYNQALQESVDVPGAVPFCSACAGVQLKSLPSSDGLEAAKAAFNKAIEKLSPSSPEMALCLRDRQVGRQLHNGSQFPGGEALPAICHTSPTAETQAVVVRQRRQLEQDDTEPQRRELAPIASTRDLMSARGVVVNRETCENFLGWSSKSYRVPAQSVGTIKAGMIRSKEVSTVSSEEEYRLCYYMAECNLQACDSSRNRFCKKDYYYQRQECSLTYKSGQMNSIQDIQPADLDVQSVGATRKIDGTLRATVTLPADYKVTSKVASYVQRGGTLPPGLAPVTAAQSAAISSVTSKSTQRGSDKRQLMHETIHAQDGCLSAQELIWNLGTELFASGGLTGEYDLVETKSNICVCCELAHYIADTDPFDDECVLIGAISYAAFTGFMTTIGTLEDNWSGFDDILENPVAREAARAPQIDPTNQEACAAFADTISTGPNGRKLYHSSYCPAISGAGCHPANTLLELADGSTLRIDEIKVGDLIRTEAGVEPVTAFMHAEHGKTADFFRFNTANATMAITQGHYLFVNGVERDPASVKVGELLKTRCCGEQPIERIEHTAEEGLFHITTDSTTYYADGVLSSTYVAYVPLNVWKVAGGLYPRVRYTIGLPITPEGEGVLSIFWLLDVYEAVGMPSFLRGLLWPLTMASTLFAELLNTAVTQLPASTTAVALMSAFSLRTRVK